MLRFLIPGWSVSYMNWYKVQNKSHLLSNVLISWSLGVGMILWRYFEVEKMQKENMFVW